MEKFIVKGGKKLFGTIEVPVAKNAALPIIAASIMLDGETQIKKCPRLSDIYASADIINSIGSVASFEEEAFCVLYKDSPDNKISKELCQRMRSGILYIAPLAYRKGKVTVYSPGGCTIGKRPIDIHLEGLKALGAEISIYEDEVTIKAENGFKGAIFKLRIPSVGATQTLLMAAAIADGVTVLKNCAKEPEIVDLIHFLNFAGAKIIGAGRSEIIIRGVSRLTAVEYTPIPDRIFAATVLSAVSACKGACALKNYPIEYMEYMERLLKKTGLTVLHFLNLTYVYKYKEKNANIETHTSYYPGFSTDMGPLLSAATVNSEGELRLRETVFENRFSYMEAFNSLGLSCKLLNNMYIQQRGDYRYKTYLDAKDLRAGAAIVIAALARKGEFSITGLEYIDRGYEKLEAVFCKLGADIRRETVENSGK